MNGEATVTIEREAPRDEICATVVGAVAAAREHGESPTEPLHSAVDSDALNRLFRDRPAAEGTVRFAWADCEVTVHSDRRVVVVPDADGEDRPDGGEEYADAAMPSDGAVREAPSSRSLVDIVREFYR